LNKAVFLDRDGVINRAILKDGIPHPPRTATSIEFFPDVLDSINSLKSNGFVIIVVTNQPDVATGIQTIDEVEKIHDLIRCRFPVDEIQVCYHVDIDKCSCRKPKPGMLKQAAKKWLINLSESAMIGDRWRDVEAGKSAGCQTILIRGEHREQLISKPDAIVDSLYEASQLIILGKV